MKTKNFKTDDLFTVKISYYLKYLLSKTPLIVIALIISGFIGVFLANKLTVVSYQATAKLIRYDKKISMPKDVPYKFQNFNYDTALQTIRTRENLSEAIEVLGLETTVEKLYSSYDIRRRKRSDIIEILYKASQKEDAVKGANALAQIFLKNFYKVQNAATKEVLTYYQKQKKSLNVEVNKLLAQKEKFNKANKILSIKVQKDYMYEQLNEIALNLIDTKVLLNEYNTKIKEIDVKLKKIPYEIQLEYSVRSADKKAISNKEKLLAKLKQKYTKYNPKIKTLKNEIKKMKLEYNKKKSKKTIPDEITYGNNPLYTALTIEMTQSKIGVKSSKNRIVELNKQKKDMENEIKELNQLEKKYSIIDNKIKEKNSLLDLVIQRQNELKIALESSQEDFKFLEKAKPPKYPESNYKKAIVLGTVFFTLIFILGAFILRFFFDFRVKGAFDIEKRFLIKLIAKFSNNNKENKNTSLEFITNLMKSLKNKKILLVTSDVKGTGKSQIIDEITYFCSKTEQKVLYIQTIDEFKKEAKDAVIDCKDISSLDLSKANPINEFVYKKYILNDEVSNYYFAKLNNSKLMIEKLNNSRYDLVILEFPSYEENSNLLKVFLPLVDLLLLVFKANLSLRNKIDPIITELNSQEIKNVKGVLYGINKIFL